MSLELLFLPCALFLTLFYCCIDASEANFEAKSMTKQQRREFQELQRRRATFVTTSAASIYQGYSIESFCFAAAAIVTNSNAKPANR